MLTNPTTTTAATEADLRRDVRAAEASGDPVRLADAQGLLADCYWRQGRTDDARAVLRAALVLLPVEGIEPRVKLTNKLLMVERMAGRCHTVTERSPAAIADAELLGKPIYRAQAHANYADALSVLGDTDRAFDHYTAAHFYFGEAGDVRRQAATDNNLALLLVTAGRPVDALTYIDRAQLHYEETENYSALGQLYETRAQAYIGTGELDAALDAINLSVKLIPEHERGSRAESLRTKGKVHDLRGEVEEAQRCYMEAISLLGKTD
jgi:tetratricopeptide (TPR) repeat protein